MTIRTRFAPSPTGSFHIGSARTAFYCWLQAKASGGDFVLRIEDTDRARSTQESVQTILDAMHWLGLEWSEAPVYQSQRTSRYLAVAEELLESHQAYYCDCSIARLESLREEQLQNKQKPRYDGHCRNRNLEAASQQVLRFRNPETGRVIVEDCIHGHVEIDNQELDDLILLRSDGTPTYNFCVVVDDWDMSITHVIRGDDHLTNTPRQINILKALKASSLPIYAHVPMILGGDGKRLSKRHGAVSVLEYRKMGILPHALLNYLVRLGFSHGDQEIFSLEELIEFFDLHHLNKSPAAFDLQKLLWLNQHYIKIAEPETLEAILKEHLNELGLSDGPDLIDLIKVQQGRVHTMAEMAEKSRFLFETPTLDEHQLKETVKPEYLNCLELLVGQLESIDKFEPSALHELLHRILEASQLKLAKLGPSLRLILTGGFASPPLDQTMGLLGRDETLARLNFGLSCLR